MTRWLDTADVSLDPVVWLLMAVLLFAALTLAAALWLLDWLDATRLRIEHAAEMPDWSSYSDPAACPHGGSGRQRSLVRVERCRLVDRSERDHG